MSRDTPEQHQSTKQSTFKTLLIKQLAIAITLSLIITVPLVTLPAYLFVQGAVGSDIERVENISHEAINTHLTTGWQAPISSIGKSRDQSLYHGLCSHL